MKNQNLDTIHKPVMLTEITAYLTEHIKNTQTNQNPPTIVDATLGMGGHTKALLTTNPHINIIGIDRDKQAIEIATKRLQKFGNRFKAIHATYDQIPTLFAKNTITGFLFDLGVSSLQLDNQNRGFSYSQNAPLDMRMNQETGTTAQEIIATYTEGNLRRIFEIYGDEKLAGKYARAIISNRTTSPIITTQQLVNILQEATPAALKNTRHPAKKVFQALRIEVNQELNIIKTAIPAAITALAVGGRLAVMSYQSGEDKIVKKILKHNATDTSPPGLPYSNEVDKPILEILTRKALTTTQQEQQENPRSKPVKTRIAQKIREGESK